MNAAEKRRQMLEVVTPTCRFFGDMRGVRVLEEATDAGIEEIWHRHFALWWQVKQRDKAHEPAH